MRKKISDFLKPSFWDLWGFIVSKSPVFGAGLTAYLGYLEEWPWAWIATTGCLAFGGLGVGLVSFKIWVTQQSAEHKFRFISPVVNWNGPDSISIGLDFRNDAVFPLYVRIDELRTTVENRINSHRKMVNREFVLGPGEPNKYADATIRGVDGDNPAVVGVLEFEISYGKNNSRPYKIKREFDLYIPRDISKQFTWSPRIASSETGQLVVR